MRKKMLLIVAMVLLLQLVWVPASLAAPPACGGGVWHTVRCGETLSTIGWTYGVSPYSICTSNGLTNCNYIYAGQTLWIPSTCPSPSAYTPTCCKTGCSAYHTVTCGQTLSGIASWYGVSAWSIAKANGVYDLNRIYAGQTLCIPGRYW